MRWSSCGCHMFWQAIGLAMAACNGRLYLTHAKILMYIFWHWIWHIFWHFTWLCMAYIWHSTWHSVWYPFWEFPLAFYACRTDSRFRVIAPFPKRISRALSSNKSDARERQLNISKLRIVPKAGLAVDLPSVGWVSEPTYSWAPAKSGWSGRFRWEGIIMVTQRGSV